jgi:hypothetical protein
VMPAAMLLLSTTLAPPLVPAPARFCSTFLGSCAAQQEQALGQDVAQRLILLGEHG